MIETVVHFGLANQGKSNEVAVTPEIARLLASNCVVAVGVSGGKDSDACAIATDRHLRAIGHSGPRVLVHADLGRVEWRDSLRSCERLAKRLGWDLMIVQRKAGDLLARWQGRWANNVARYVDLSCVKLILPWSTPSMRFCTSELKVDQITAALKKRFPGQDIINVSGIRRQESPTRAKMPVAAPLSKLQRKGSAGIAWNAIIEWPLQDVMHAIWDAGLELHEAYTRYGASRVSCAFCIMSSQQDLRAAVACEDNHDLYRAMVELEADSTFAFQGNSWLADVAPDLLSESLIERVARSKAAAQERQVIEGELPKHLLYTPGWPTAMPTVAEAGLIASVRRRVCGVVGLNAQYLTADDVLWRYGELMGLKAAA
ncbi:phosphoadenosine phosphosulfate reductase family protein [Ralstonia pseudosolanacearum]|uniref:phosphoadenosine phosphosulfate reductase domain-containing protein n=1 Tax=Ralstonia pseudosolanacearum TaxID=1310165 RepID=UPI001FF9233E|nr:phosphoadenosine phosphosulfate reductase family protein [Ralstonia pseudosolanacearum]